ncbi:MAG: hypothetical protein K1060chlam5_00154 [Candidatus Anoxychlamydiales bacterium]|nr:hypothetical protein [Candidatus Anoxychlamydiales bacterium]
MNMISYEKEKKYFKYRIGSIIKKNNRILLCKIEPKDFWMLPGGRVNFFESSLDTLKRELFEELNEKDINIENLLWTIEDIYENDDRKVHEISMIYNVLLPKNSKLFNLDEYLSYEGDLKLFFKWFDIDKIDDILFKPTFLKKRIKKLSVSFEHIINKEIQDKILL